MQLKPVSPTAKAPAQNFTGDVYVNQAKTPGEPSRLIVGYVRFTPGARTNWHSAPSARPCTAPTAPADRHPRRYCHPDAPRRHRLDPTRRRTLARRYRRQHDVHFAMLEGDGTTWLEPVTDQRYQAAHQD